MADPLPGSTAHLLPVIHDSAAAVGRSLMHKQKVLCNGEANGVPCRHYWAVRRIVASQNSDFLTKGEKLRFCKAWGAEPLEFGDGREEQMVYCTEYVPRVDGKRYDADFETYSAISSEDLAALQDQTPNASKSSAVSIDDVLAEEAKEANNE